MGYKLPPGMAAPSDCNPPPKNRQLLTILGLLIGLGWGVFWLLGVLLNGLVWLIPPSVEQQATDAFSLSLLQQTYGHIAGATDFFERSRQQGTLTAFLETHPAPQRRVTQLQRLVKQQGYHLSARSPGP